MADPEKPELAFPNIHGFLRISCGFFGVVFAFAAALVLYFPPNQVIMERDALGQTTKSTISSADSATPSVVLLAGGFALLVYGINGYRITKLTAGSIGAETASTAGSKATEFYKEPAGGGPPLEVAGDSASAPEPTQPPAKILATATEDLAVYELADVPTTVIKDALDKWPLSETSPSNLGEFEFATRRRGQGNHPWTLKFRGKKPVVVSYGGQAKTAATVTPDE